LRVESNLTKSFLRRKRKMKLSEILWEIIESRRLIRLMGSKEGIEMMYEGLFIFLISVIYLFYNF
jgi:hypothetical protein